MKKFWAVFTLILFPAMGYPPYEDLTNFGVDWNSRPILDDSAKMLALESLVRFVKEARFNPAGFDELVLSFPKFSYANGSENSEPVQTKMVELLQLMANRAGASYPNAFSLIKGKLNDVVDNDKLSENIRSRARDALVFANSLGGEGIR
ncbi:MAG: hypothetical protein C5B49_01100 [Bdellovibrio sp.]|nr:MAG: hypothetical protein C5B49_01100 [Bdellovibrio sp.]